jgi:hypothetical protein
MNRMCSGANAYVRDIDIVDRHSRDKRTAAVDRIAESGRCQAVTSDVMSPHPNGRDVTLVPLTGLATVMFEAKAGRDNISPETIARTTRANRHAAWPTYERYLFANFILLRGVRGTSIPC